ncbi:MAG: FAD-dependent oxidoreductase [Brumimicrobium sp.]
MKVLIVGGGLAGICLGHTFIHEGISFKIIDAGTNHSSKIAAGMINPMVFRKMVKTWRGDELIPFLKRFYPIVEGRIGKQFFFERKIRRVFSTLDEKNYWDKRLTDETYNDYIHPYEDSEPTPDYVKDKFGSAWVKSPGYVDAKLFMRENHRFFSKEQLITYEEFDFKAFNYQELTYKDETFTHVIFAEGYRGKENPFFGYLPFIHTKGEVISVKGDTLKTDEILNRKCFVLPTVDNTFKIGSTFEWHTTDTSPTQAAKEQLLEQYEQLSTAPINIVEQEAGIRPTVSDRRPLIGVHPEIKNVYIFNGMGTKGYLIAPFFAKEFTDYLKGLKELDDEVNIKRFYKKHYKKS